ncbi:hypothetical protein DESUT3_30940 [Desulfuromonas versatilis]|uniref:Sulfatase N-terminal domain-containing protein n=1 Tax=Desulfuromonas versatilis TaxID=2802975 RepID=A0ABN6E133_9BACT|nr:LTA synthase family protein [Desulfuromonas versatilis]BCR06025.1 hypothetical protein DESUT3_30940 [Desulfuromonas versatilis]
MNLPCLRQRLKSLARSRYLVFLLLVLAATRIVQQCGGLPWPLPAWRLEIPLLLYLYLLGNLATRPSRLQPVIAALPILLLYAVFDLYYLQFGRLLRITEVNEIPEMLQVLPWGVKILGGLALGLPLGAFALSLAPRRLGRAALAGLPLLALLVAVKATPEGFMTGFEKTQKEIVFFSDALSAGNNGRLSMVLYNEARRGSYLAETVDFREAAEPLKSFEEAVAQVKAQRSKRNVHLIVLESFLDPELLRGAHFSRSPVHPDFAKLVGGKGSLSISPVFGGGTAQAEFEVLCGVPALRELSGIEFDLFTGAKTLCLPHILEQGGYQAIATNAFVPDFFNSTNAYEGMGFDQIYYPREYAPGLQSYLSAGDVSGETYMFDGDLLSQNLEFVQRQLKENRGEPLFNYVISMYGHLPHDINLDKRPLLIAVAGDLHDEQLVRAVNQHYYRTQALAAFIKGLQRIDPKSLIVLVSDHLPPLTYGPNTYRDLGYLDGAENYMHLNRVYFIENGKPVQYQRIHHFDIPKIVLNYVSRGAYCRDQACGFTRRDEAVDKTVYRDGYMAIMARAMM